MLTSSPSRHESRHDDEPGASPRLVDRLAVGRDAVVGVALLGLLAVCVTLLLVQRGAPRPVERLDLAATVQPSGSAAAATPSPAGHLVVDVVGAVRRPGLVRVPPGSRVHDVVQAAGGFTRPRAARSVNLARPVADGEQVVVGVAAATGEGGGAGPSVAGSGAPVRLNAATAAELETLPGVGPVLAQRILEHRASLGGAFTSVEQLRDVSGIGDATFADLAPRVTL